MSQNQTSEKRAVVLSISGAIGIALALHVLAAYILTDPWVVSLFKPEKEKKEKKEWNPEQADESETILIINQPPPRAVIPPSFPEVAKPTTPKKAEPAPPEKVPPTKTAKLKPQPPQPEQKPEPPIKPEPPKPKEQDIAHARTSDDQLKGTPEDTNIEGERNTLEASNAEAVDGAPALPSVTGEKPKHDGHFETVDTNFQDGKVEHMQKGADSNKPPQKPQEESEEQLAQEGKESSILESLIDGKDLEEENLATTDKQDPDILKGTKKTAAKPDQPLSNKERVGGDKEKKTIPNKDHVASAPKQKPQPKKTKKKRTIKIEEIGSADKGFRSQAKATAFQGSIHRKSKIASLNVKATPRGKYMARVSKEIEKEWQRIFALNGHVVRNGTLRLSFTVNANGKVKNMRTIAEILGSENQKGLTFQAIYDAKIPPMPAELKKLQAGEPIEFTYTFGFQ